MAVAMLYPETQPGRRRTSSVAEEVGIVSTTGLSKARAVLAFSRELAKRLTMQMYDGGRGMSQQAIAAVLGVSQKTISKDLEGVYTEGINSSRSSRRGRVNEGRPPGSGRRRVGPQPNRRRTDTTAADAAAHVG